MLGRETLANEAVQRLFDILVGNIGNDQSSHKRQAEFAGERDRQMQMVENNPHPLYGLEMKQVEGKADFSQLDKQPVGEEAGDSPPVKVKCGDEQSHGNPVPHALTERFRYEES